MIVCVALTAVALIVASPELAYPLPVTHLPVMGWGVLLAMALQDDKWKARLQWAGHPWVPLCTFGLLVIALFKLSIDQRWLYEGGLAVLGIVPTVLVAHLVMSPNGAASRALSLQPLVWLGERSYGFYLWHFPIVAFLSFQGHPPWMIFAIGLPSSLVVTELSWRFVERPFNQLKDRRFGSPVNLPGEPVS
jgi:peptidoglycan/LPS O-acetylase OafA/YrhL